LKHPNSIDLGEFRRVATFLTVFVGLLLGFFLSSSMHRWFSCANGFLELFDAIRNLQMQLLALGVSQDRVALCLRYGVLSAWFLSTQLQLEAHYSGSDVPSEALWAALDEVQDKGGKYVFLNDKEKEQLQKAHDPSALIWTWVGSLVGRMAQDKEIPPMASPTYGRIMHLSQSAHASIRTVRASISVQAPFIYVQMLSVLVHTNNILNAVTFGVTLGVASCTTKKHSNGKSAEEHSTSGQVARDMQDVVVAFCTSVVAPCIYQALLHVAICIASPSTEQKRKSPQRNFLIVCRGI